MDRDQINRLMTMRIKDNYQKRKEDNQAPFFFVALIGLVSILIVTFFSITSRAIINEEFEKRLRLELWKTDEINRRLLETDEINRRLLEIEKNHEDLLNKLLLEASE